MSLNDCSVGWNSRNPRGRRLQHWRSAKEDGSAGAVNGVELGAHQEGVSFDGWFADLDGDREIVRCVRTVRHGPRCTKGCTGFASTRHYCSGLQRLHGLEPQTTAHWKDCRAPETHELAVLNPLFFGRCGFEPRPGHECDAL